MAGPIHRGAYGFRLHYTDPEQELTDLIELDASMPEVTVAWRHASTTVDIEDVGRDRVAYGHRKAGAFWACRDPATITFDFPTPPVPGSLVHPNLTIGISVHARWRGDLTLHGGAFETSAGAWGIMGAREAGKSAMLAELASRGYPIVADDLLALQGSMAWAGPDCVDLRPDTAERFEKSRYLGIVGGRPRYRLSTPPSRPVLPFRGFFILDWHESRQVVVEPMDPRERLKWLYQQEYILLVGWPDPAKHLRLLGLPAWNVRRPPHWGGTDEVIGRILEITENPAYSTELVVDD
ncbi:MAG TPA: hypothetical protein VFH11_01055 [Gemmatimonadota bacterium]|nr:hypothetical protein [Gemmatimonadota bacterium]